MTQSEWGHAMEGLLSWARKDAMTDPRPEITVRADGAFVVLAITRPEEHWLLYARPDVEEIPLSTEEALDLEEQLRGAAMSIMHTIALDEQRLAMNDRYKPAEHERMIAAGSLADPKSWRDRAIEEPML